MFKSSSLAMLRGAGWARVNEFHIPFLFLSFWLRYKGILDVVIFSFSHFICLGSEQNK